MNPRSPAPQASVLILARLRAHSTRLLYSGYLSPEIEGKVINTLVKLENNGLEEQPVRIIGYYLNHLAVNAFAVAVLQLYLNGISMEDLPLPSSAQMTKAWTL